MEIGLMTKPGHLDQVEAQEQLKNKIATRNSRFYQKTQQSIIKGFTSKQLKRRFDFYNRT